MANLTDMVEERQITFDVGKYQVSKLGSYSASTLEHHEERRIEYLGLLRTLTTQVLERKIVEDSYPVKFTYKVPSTWWQHLKQTKLPKWFRDRYPVRFDVKSIKRTVYVTRKATYPLADIIVPKDMGSVVIRDSVSSLRFFEDEDRDQANN